MGSNGPTPPGRKPPASPAPPPRPRGMIDQTGNRPGGSMTGSYKHTRGRPSVEEPGPGYWYGVLWVLAAGALCCLIFG